MLIKFYKEMFCKKEEKKEEKCPYMEYIEEQEKVLKRNDNGTSTWNDLYEDD